ncbi:MAG TPA: GNAT family N-acetyltransferase [Dehalococcoidales bacterium]
MDKPLIIKPLDTGYFDTVVELALENYLLERHSARGLCERANKSYFSKQLEELFSKGTGRMAFEDNTLVGFLAFGEIFTINKSGAKGAASPLWGYGIRHNERGEIIGRLFQDIAAELCENFAQGMNVSVYAHDTEVLWTYIMSAFYMEHTGVVRDVSSPIEAEMSDKYSFREVGKKELIHHKHEIVELYRGLINHLRVSPVFYHCRQFLPIENRFDDFLKNDMRVFAVFDSNRLVGMIDSEPINWGFTVDDTEALSMGDIFIEPAYRGSGIAIALLKFANDELKSNGVKRLFVMHGTINPSARGFWDKYFTNYSYTMSRLIDPDMLGTIKPV